MGLQVSSKEGIKCGKGWISRDKRCRKNEGDKTSSKLSKVSSLLLSPDEYSKSDIAGLIKEAHDFISGDSKKANREKLKSSKNPKEDKKDLLAEEEQAFVFWRVSQKMNKLLKNKGEDDNEVKELFGTLQKLASKDREAFNSAKKEIQADIDEGRKARKATTKTAEALDSFVEKIEKSSENFSTKEKEIEKEVTAVEPKNKKSPIPAAIIKKNNADYEEDPIMAKIIEDSDVYIQITPDGLNGLAKDGQLKNSFFEGVEGIGEGDSDYQGMRIGSEEKVLGVGKKAKPEERPIYAYLEKPEAIDSTREDLEGYGAISLKLKPEVKERSTMVLGDSIVGDAAENGSFASPLTKPNKKTIGEYEIEDGKESVGDIRVNGSKIGYIETQIFGGVTLDSIDSITLPNYVLQFLDKKVMAILESKGISIVFSD